MYCVGLEESEKRVSLLMVDSKSKASEPLKVVRLLLDEHSAALVSPFYKHLIQYSPVEGESEVYQLEGWIGSEFRIKKKDSEETFATAVKDIIRNSFFPLMMKTVQVKEWQRRVFCWDTFHRGLSTRYHPDFSLKEWTNEKLEKFGRADYWKIFKETHKHLLDPAIRSLEINKNTVVENNLNHLFGVLDQWKAQAHITGYFRHRLLEVPKIQTLYQSGFSRILSLSGLTYGEIHDLHQLHNWLNSLGGGDMLEKFAPNFQDQKRLLTITLKDCVVPVLKLYLLHNKALENYEKKAIRKLLIVRLLVPVIKKSLELNASLSKSTIIPVSRKNLLYYYGRMFSINTQYVEEVEEEEEESVEKEEEYRGDLLDFQQKDCSEVLSYCREGFQQEMDGVKWRICEKEANGKGPLYFLTTKPELLEVEEKMREIWCVSMEPSEHRVVSTDFSIEDWQNSYLFMDDVDRGLYQIRFTSIPFSLTELKEEKDLSLTKEMLSANIYETTLVRPNTSEFTKSRLLEYFTRESERGTSNGISVKDLTKRLHTTQSLTMSTGRVMPLLVLLDCHFLSLKELFILLRFIERRKSDIKRVVFLGALDLIPLDSDGNAFLDLLQWKEPGFVRTKTFQYEQLRKETQLIVNQMKESGEIHFIEKNALESWFSVILAIFLTIGDGKEEDFGMKSARIQDLVKFTKKETFVINKSHLMTLSRNEVNHLLLIAHSLVVILDNDLSKKWILREEKFPNLRYTLPYMSKISDK